MPYPNRASPSARVNFPLCNMIHESHMLNLSIDSTMISATSEVWWQPAALLFQQIHVRGSTEWTTIALGDADGVVGQGEITGTQLERSAVDMTARLANRLRGVRLSSDDDVMQALRIPPQQLESDQIMATAVSALRCAAADALSQRHQMRMADWLQLTHDAEVTAGDRVPLYANINRSMLPDDQGPVDRGPDDFAEMATEAVSNGFGAIKCAPFDECRAPFDSSGLPYCAEFGLQRVQSVRGAIGPDLTLFVDCHSRFDLDSALTLEPELRAAGGNWFEEPVDPISHGDDLRAIRDRSELPVAGAEHGYGIGLFQRLIDEDVLDIVMPDVKFCGGPVEAYRIGMELETRIPGSVSMHCPSGPLSLLASAHATAAFRSDGTLPLEHAVYEVDWRHEVMEPYEQIRDGEFAIPDGTGLGARVDPAAVAFRGRQWEE